MIKYITILPIIIYLLFVWKKVGIQKSISESYYTLTNIKKYYLWFFIFGLIGTSLFMLGTYVYNQPEIKADSIFLFFAALGICYTASAAQFKRNKITETWHMSGAIGGFVLGYIFIIAKLGFSSIWLIIPSVIIIFIFGLIYNKNNEVTVYYSSVDNKVIKTNKKENYFIWWVEIVALITIYLGTIID